MPASAPPDDDFIRDLVESAHTRKSWRERLQWVRDRLTEATFEPTAGRLAAIAVYLRFLATGELTCEEDGRHYRPNHHAEAALQIESALERLYSPETGWILGRILPYLPSWGEEFRRSEPLTRIRDIAHRNDIPQDLKREIKHRLQNKLHRCAGPEDLRTAEEILQRVTAPGADFSPAFVQEFRIFHEELRQFFNAMDLEDRLRAIGRTADPATAESVNAFLALKAAERSSDEQLLALVERLVGLRRVFAERLVAADPLRRSQLRLADIGLQDYAFALLSEAVGRIANPSYSGGGGSGVFGWPMFLRALATALDNLRLGQIEPEECRALLSEVAAWSEGFSGEDRFHLLRIRATILRARRLAGDYTDRVANLFGPSVETLGRALGVAEHAIKVFIEGDVRGHVVFQLSRLVDLGLRQTQRALNLPPWEAVVLGEASGVLVRAADLTEVEGRQGPLLLLLTRADGDAEIPAGVKGVALGHPMPHLSHLGVRARQAGAPFACCSTPEHFEDFASLVGKRVRLRVSSDGLFMQETGADSSPAVTESPNPQAVSIPEAPLVQGPIILALDQARSETCGAKAAAAQRLLELADRSDGLFRAPRGLAIPFGVMERYMKEVPAVLREYQALQGGLGGSPAELESRLPRLRQLVRAVPVPPEVGQAVARFFGPDARLAVRSSSNGEDLEHLAGAGLYESVVNVTPATASQAAAQVWASLWTRRAAVSRIQAGIPHTRIRMAVLIQELAPAEMSFILHTVNPLTGDQDEALAELAVGLGEVLASGSKPGTPYRLACHRKTGEVKLLACGDFSFALRPGTGVWDRLDYSQVPLSRDPGTAQQMGERLARIAAFLERELGRPQDVEGAWVGGEVYLVQTRPQMGL